MQVNKRIVAVLLSVQLVGCGSLTTEPTVKTKPSSGFCLGSFGNKTPSPATIRLPISPDFVA